MVSSIYKKTFSVLMKRPFRLWGISLLAEFLCLVAYAGFIGVPAAAFCAALLLSASMSMIFLNSYRTGLEPKTAYLFSAFRKERVWHVLGGMAWMYLWIFLWSLIPVVGIVFGVIRAYEYRFTPYILMTRDDVKPTEAIKVSKAETLGYKGKMFGADMLAIGAWIVGIAVLSLLGAIPYLGVLFKIVRFVFNLAYSLLAPLFFGILSAAFYVEIQNRRAAAPQQPSAPVPEQKKKSGKAGKIVALLLACALVGGGSGFGAAALMQKNAAAQPQSTTQTSSDASVMLEAKRQAAALQVASVDTGKVLTPSEVYAQNVNSTVGITTSITTNYFGYQTTSAAAGSGFILTQDGYILTNYHVVEGSNSIKVTTYDGTSYDAQLIGYDESNDIAVLKIDASDLTPVVLGDSDTLNVGDSVVAIGNPLGELTFSLTTGVVSALNREVTLSSNVTMNLIQTDCAINSGNSGGALFNLYGEVIGITNAKYSSSSSSSEASIDNIGFAIPLNHVKNIVKSIIETGSITKPYIGVTVSSVSSEAQGYGLPTGAAVRSVEADSPAAKAGLEENDIITEVDGTAINSSTELVNYVGEKTPGDELTFKVYRQGEELELTVTIGEKTQSAMPTTTTDDAQQSQQSQGQSQQGGQLFPWGFGFGG